MKNKSVLLVSMILAFTAVGFGQKVNVDFDRSIDFSKYKTFSWSVGQVARNQLIADMIISTIEAELNSKGLVKNDASPDLRISVMAAVGMDLQGVGPSWNNERYRYAGGRGNPNALMNISTGTLIIDLVDAKAARNVWRGTASDTLPHTPTDNPTKDAKDIEKTVKNAIKKMMNKYPKSK